MKKRKPKLLDLIGYKSWVFFVPLSLVSPLFVYGIKNVEDNVGRLTLLFSVLFVAGYTLYVPRTIIFKKYQLDYLYSWYKLSRRHTKGIQEKTFIEIARREVISREKNGNKRKILEEYLQELIRDKKNDDPN
ncbi:hypothetical protein E3E35_00765 [Thermococcus sp. GR7]|uniref:hypothetical protein n=1 Tax=Thermococcus TaxID=2263 RepID=UPI00142FB9F8|nr:MULTISPECIES: hypothetical protein [Thermococcus]NJE42941.1 hypothetical protein [Thermococcus sp. GR6]NJE45961.1 hypothetical protein [Thermococcus sp. GR7]NJE78454.1 hypothetical protein [Thermococcus sp. GR4]NJF22157.1 hypothetical protein [Thermococcus sp. GR5]